MKNTHIDYNFLETLRSISRPGEPDVAITIVSIFLKNAPGILASISQSLADQQLAKATSLAHKLKSSSSNVGATRLTKLLNDFEENTEALEDYRKTFEEIRSEYGEVSKILTAFKAGEVLD